MMKKLLFITIIFLGLTYVNQAHGAFPSPATSYGYCQTWTAKANGTLGGMATTSTISMAMSATSTQADLKTATFGGKIQVYNQASSTPIDVLVTNGTNCNTDVGTAIPFTWDSYASTTGAVALAMSFPVSSTTDKKINVYFGYVSDTDTHTNDTGTFGSLGEVAVWLMGTSTTNWTLSPPWIWDRTTSLANATSSNFTVAAATVPGMVGSALSFDGVDDKSVGRDVAALDGLSKFTWLVWVNPAGYGGGGLGRIFDKRANTSTGFAFYISSGNVLNMNLDATNMSSDTSLVVLNEWQQVGVTWDGSSVTYWKNGAVFGTTDGYSTVPLTANGVAIVVGGRADVTTRGFYGILDQVKISNNNWHAMDILTDYNNSCCSTRFWTFGATETPTSAGVQYPSFIVSLGRSFQVILGRSFIK